MGRAGVGTVREGPEVGRAWRAESEAGEKGLFPGKAGCLFSAPVVLWLRADVPKGPFKAKDSLPVVVVVTVGSAKQILGCVLALFGEL